MACATRRSSAKASADCGEQATGNELSSTQEDSLEAIYLIAQKKHAARAKDIAAALKVRASSVTSALRTLAALDLVNYTPYDIITLTDKGLAVAEKMYRRHVILTKGLTRLGVPPEIAEEDACRIEHIISEETFEAISSHFKE